MAIYSVHIFCFMLHLILNAIHSPFFYNKNGKRTVKLSINFTKNSKPSNNVAHKHRKTSSQFAKCKWVNGSADRRNSFPTMYANSYGRVATILFACVCPKSLATADAKCFYGFTIKHLSSCMFYWTSIKKRT